jgi:hypothetical protein
MYSCFLENKCNPRRYQQYVVGFVSSIPFLYFWSRLFEMKNGYLILNCQSSHISGLLIHYASSSNFCLDGTLNIFHSGVEFILAYM